MSDDWTRRRALQLVAGGTSALMAGCSRGNSGDKDILRHWFHTRHQLDVSDADLDAVLDYMQHLPRSTDPSLQPPLLFDPEVDAG